MKDGRLFLKVKIKSLAAEAIIIRRETKRAPKFLRSELSMHRRTTVRAAARSAIVAYGFVRGRQYRQIEPKTDTQPNWKEVARLVEKYGVRDETGTYDGYKAVQAARIEQAARLTTWASEAEVTQPT